ncbi:hypothetical protein GO491_01160 [Flavobacteriaceae bacterium Ap0902]|nr:hypothetical protein [Flavobacteriaceae bacterium Ap0902]
MLCKTCRKSESETKKFLEEELLKFSISKNIDLSMYNIDTVFIKYPKEDYNQYELSYEMKSHSDTIDLSVILFDDDGQLLFIKNGGYYFN